MEVMLRNRLEEILKSYKSAVGHYLVFPYLVPELKDSVDFDQQSHYHCYDVYDHILHSIDEYMQLHPENQDWVCKLVLLLHDIGKPYCFTMDEKGGHFYGHAGKSEEISREVLTRLGYPSHFIATVTCLVRVHDTICDTEESVLKFSKMLGNENYLRLLDIQEADIKAHSDFNQTVKLEKLVRARTIYERFQMV